MAEIRKHNPRLRGKLDEALAKALGEDVRPVAPGAKPDPGTEDAPPDQAAEPARPAFTAVPTTGAGWTTFTGKPSVLAKPPAEDDEDDDWDDEDDDD